MQDLYRDASRVEILNEKEFPNNLNIRVIDFNQTFGCFIDREENNARGVYRMGNSIFRKSTENFEIFMPDVK
jgi:hypothetical protein